MPKLKAWISAMRLRTLPLAVSCILIGSGLALGKGSFDLFVMVGMLLTMVLMQILSNFANDLGDFKKGTDNADRVGPMRATQSGIISPAKMKRAVVLVALLCLATGVTTLSYGHLSSSGEWIYIFILGLISIGAALGYTLGKKAYGYLGLGDISVALFFGPIGVLTTLFLHGNQPTPLDVFVSLSCGMWSVGVLNLNNIRDLIPDRAAGKITLAVRLGSVGAKVYHFCLLGIGSVAWMYLFNFWHIALYLILSFSIMNMVLLLRKGEGARINPLLPQLALSTFTLSVLYILYEYYG